MGRSVAYWVCTFKRGVAVQTPSGLDLSRIVFIGRTADEYLAMFNLSWPELKNRRVLDCPAGACSFTAHANAQGIKATAVDSAYHYPVRDLEAKGLQDIDYTMASLQPARDLYRWNFFKDIEELTATRRRALNDFVSDMKQFGASRYGPALLPQLPFADKEFDITLSGHFLFLYADKIDDSFHRNTLKELMRVTRRDIRVFPTVDMNGCRYPGWDALIAWSREQGWDAKEIMGSYEFQRNANTMLWLTAH